MNIAKYGKNLLGVAAIGSAGLLGACVAQPYPPPPPAQYVIAAAPSAAACLSCGVITAIQARRTGGYQLTLRMDDGTTRSVAQATQPAFQVGDRVQILTRTSPPRY